MVTRHKLFENILLKNVNQEGESAMPWLTDRDLGAIQNYVDMTRARADLKGLRMEVETDPWAFHDFLQAQEHTHGVPTTHNPATTDVRPGNFFWLQLRHGSEIVACHAQRWVETRNLIELVRTHSVFMDLTPTLDHQRVDLYPEAAELFIAGRIGIGGGFWIRKDWRGRGLTEIFSRVGRAIALRQFSLEWYVAFFLNTDRRTRFGRQGAAFANSVPLLNGYFPPYGRQEDIQLMYMSRSDILRQISHEIRAQPEAA